eukprot:Trichotokara_eunicae@DN547_c0_g1_i1.p1
MLRSLSFASLICAVYGKPSLETVIVQDTSVSIFNSNVNWSELLKYLINRGFHNTQRTGVVAIHAFSDKPLPPLGRDNDVCHEEVVGFGELNELSWEEIEVMMAERLVIRNGNDIPENQLGAVLDAVLAVKWTTETPSDAPRVVDLVTDAPPHYEGDSDLLPRTRIEESDCDSFDYPSVELFAKALKDAEAYLYVHVPRAIAAEYVEFCEAVLEHGANWCFVWEVDNTKEVQVGSIDRSGVMTELLINSSAEGKVKLSAALKKFYRSKLDLAEAEKYLEAALSTHKK